MTLKEIQELIKLISKSELSEFKMKNGEFELSIRTKLYERAKAPEYLPVPPAMPAAPAGLPPAASPSAPPSPAKATPGSQDSPAAEETGDESRYVPIKSPMVGTFYRASAPEKPPFVKVGDIVQVGTVVCIVEAMKLYNEIESDQAGRIVKIIAENGTPVEFEQVLFLLDPNG
jgi:acetyl-CoA carboxylase biotin carboxyl carrier protein